MLEPHDPDPSDGLTDADVTELLRRRSAGEATAGDALLDLVYDELRELAARHLARERADHTLQPTALIHEAWMRLDGRPDDSFPSRGHYFSLASRVMRQLLTDHARSGNAEKRGGGRERVTLEDREGTATPDPIDVLTLDQALTELAEVDPELERIVVLRFFGGLTASEAAETMGMPLRTLERRHRTASAWLRRALGEAEER